MHSFCQANSEFIEKGTSFCILSLDRFRDIYSFGKETDFNAQDEINGISSQKPPFSVERPGKFFDLVYIQCFDQRPFPEHVTST
jgi:hypothetical protein